MRVERESPTRGRRPSPPSPLPPPTPVRVRGTPPRSGRLTGGPSVPSPLKRDCARGQRGTRVETVRREKVVTPGSRSNAQACRELDDEEGAIQEFYGQLWLIPDAIARAANSAVRARVREEELRVRDLVWIRRDLWDSREFGVADCFPAASGDRWVRKPAPLRFAEEVWGKGERESFATKLKSAMAGRGRGRPPRPRRPEEDWDYWIGGEWPQQSPPFYPPHPMGPPPPQVPPPPGPYGFYQHPQQPFHQPPPYNPHEQFNQQYRPGGKPRGPQQSGKGRQGQSQPPNQKSEGQLAGSS